MELDQEIVQQILFESGLVHREYFKNEVQKKGQRNGLSSLFSKKGDLRNDDKMKEIMLEFSNATHNLPQILLKKENIAEERFFVSEIKNLINVLRTFDYSLVDDNLKWRFQRVERLCQTVLKGFPNEDTW